MIVFVSVSMEFKGARPRTTGWSLVGSLSVFVLLSDSQSAYIHMLSNMAPVVPVKTVKQNHSALVRLTDVVKTTELNRLLRKKTAD